MTPVRLLLLAVIISGIGPVLVRGSPVGPASTAFWRVAIALPFAIWLGRYALRMSPGDILLALLSGLLLAADLVLWNSAVLATSVMEATILVMLFPLLVAAGEILFFRRRLDRNLLIGGVIAFIGTAVIAIGASGDGQSSLKGDLMAIAAAVFYAGSLLISGYLCKRNGARGVTVWVMVGAALGSLPLGLIEPSPLPVDPFGWAYLAVYGLLTFAAYALYNHALAILPTTLVAISGYGQPLVATLLAALLLAEIPSPANLLGAGIVIAGLLLATLRQLPSAAPSPEGRQSQN